MTTLELDVIECMLNGFGSVGEIVEVLSNSDNYRSAPETHVVRGIVSDLSGAGLKFVPGVDRRS